MSGTPVSIRRRPFSIEPLSGIMLPDGIFDAAIYTQLMTCYITNTSNAPLLNVSVYLEGVADPNIAPVARTFHFAEIAPGASVQVQWQADFRNALPGKPFVSIIAQAQGMALTRILNRIFVSKTTYDNATQSYICEIPEGTITISTLEVISPQRDPKDPNDIERPNFGPWIPTRMVMSVNPSSPYAGIHGELPFNDPWWKVIAWIIAGLAAVGGAIAAATGNGTAYAGVSGKFDESTGYVDCCEPDLKGSAKNLEKKITIAGVASAIATGAAVVGMADDADPWWRGQKATPPRLGELTTAENVEVHFSYPDAPNAGVAYPVDVEWKYTRITTGQSYGYDVSETRTNIHTTQNVKVEAPEKWEAHSGPLVVRAQFTRDTGKLYRADDLHVFALITAPEGYAFRIPLLDDGIFADENAADGVYTGSLDFGMAYEELLRVKQKYRGKWQIFVFAQDVNDATPDMKPEEAAQHIGGMVVASALKVTLDPTGPCPVVPDRTVIVP